MTPTTIIIAFLAYVAALIGISYISSRKTDNSGFFTGNRRAPWPIVAIATVGAAISGVTFISVPGMVAEKGLSYLQMVLGFIVGYAVIAFLLVPLFYRRNLISIYGYLGERFGMNTYRTGAWFFFISKMLGASVRFFVVCIVLQTLVCTPLGIPFWVNVIVTVALVWLYTFRGGVRSLIWTDAFKSFCLVVSALLCVYFIAANLNFSPADLYKEVTGHESFRIFYFDNPSKSVYFWKQFIAGIFMAIAINGLDQDMMQRHLACRDSQSSQKNMITSGIMQFFVIALFLILGIMLVIYIDRVPGLEMPAKSDEIFGLVAAHPTVPAIVGIMFIIGLVAAAYSAAGSAMVSLTTSFSVDILDGSSKDETALTSMRKLVHIAMAITMAAVIIIFYIISEEDAISAVYTLASYTYGPILGLFAFGMFSKRRVYDRLVPVICIAAPLICLFTKSWLHDAFNYEMSFELLLLNALLTCLGLAVFSGNANKITDTALKSS